MTHLADPAGPKDHLTHKVARIHVEDGLAPDDDLETTAEEDPDPRPLLALLRWRRAACTRLSWGTRHAACD